MLHTQVVADNTVDAGAAIIEVIVGEYDQHGILPLFAANQYCVSTEELELLHSVI